MEILLQLIASGVAVGMIYAAIAFGYQLTFATSKTLNFGQGEALALGALFGLTLVPFVGYWLMIPLVLVFGFALGAVAWYVLGRPHQTTVRGDHDTVADVVAETSEEFRNRVRARAEEQRRRYAEQRQDKP